VLWHAFEMWVTAVQLSAADRRKQLRAQNMENLNFWERVERRFSDVLYNRLYGSVHGTYIMLLPQ
jgi:hypothetical protein